MTEEKILPPWMTFPEFSPFDFFWRDAGQPWFCYIWDPFWKKMSKEEQNQYLDIWNAPETWRFFYDEEWQSDVFN